MDWDDIRYFLAVARRGTLAEAAQDLEVNASTVHRRVRALEQTVGGRLFDRSPRGYALTALGEAAMGQATEVEESVLGLRRTILGHDREARGTVRISLPSTLLEVVGPHFARFRRRCAHITLHVRAADELVDLAKDADVALRISMQPPLDAIARSLGPVAWARYRHRDADDQAPWIHLEGFERVPAVRDWQRGEGCMVTTRVADAVALLRAGPFQGLLPCYCGDRADGLVRVGEVHPDRRTQLWLLIHTDLRRSARVRAFVDDFTGSFEPLVA